SRLPAEGPDSATVGGGNSGRHSLPRPAPRNTVPVSVEPRLVVRLPQCGRILRPCPDARPVGRAWAKTSPVNGVVAGMEGADATGLLLGQVLATARGPTWHPTTDRLSRPSTARSRRRLQPRRPAPCVHRPRWYRPALGPPDRQRSRSLFRSRGLGYERR